MQLFVLNLGVDGLQPWYWELMLLTEPVFLNLGITKVLFKASIIWELRELFQFLILSLRLACVFIQSPLGIVCYYVNFSLKEVVVTCQSCNYEFCFTAKLGWGRCGEVGLSFLLLATYHENNVCFHIPIYQALQRWPKDLNIPGCGVHTGLQQDYCLEIAKLSFLINGWKLAYD